MPNKNKHDLDPYCVLFGKRLADVRKEKGVAQDKLALECDIARSHAGAVERGQHNLSLKTICRLAIGLGVTASDLTKYIDDEIKSDK